MRYGQSQADVQQLIISDPSNGLPEYYGLTGLGRQQAEASARQSPLSHKTIIYTSGFSRARQTAEIVREILGAPPIHLTESLRERYFGDYERTDNGNYRKVWDYDASGADHRHANAESVNFVVGRTTKLILQLEKQYHNRDILLDPKKNDPNDPKILKGLSRNR
jgi:broad specificity phosphatase PhoE